MYILFTCENVNFQIFFFWDGRFYFLLQEEVVHPINIIFVSHDAFSNPVFVNTLQTLLNVLQYIYQNMDFSS